MGDDRLLPIFDKDAEDDACRRLGGVSRATVYREHKAGRLRFTKVGGSTRILESEIERYKRNRTRTHGRAA